MKTKIRLNKYLKDLGICSRRKADEFIEKGYIKVNDVLITELGFQIDPQIDKIEVLPELYQEKSQFRYILLNKPIGYVCSKSKADGKSIFELLPKIEGLTYAGRLDKDSHGLILLSNDGKFVYSIAGTEFEKEKEYIVRVNKPITTEYLLKQSNGSIVIDDILVKPAIVKFISKFVYKIILTQGMNRQIRKMAESLNYKVLDLERTRIDNIIDKNLPLGKWRDLTNEEIKKIK
ncbi:MAG TPA: pseudouridine synthase [Burkholderiales bacterium]|nr:pseudouridine synthase [Burkholderiales bacterium]